VDIEANPESLLGEVIASRYCIEAHLGHGTMGTVYRARHIKLGRMFAIKILHPRLLGDDNIRRRFDREAELAGSLHHPNVVSVVDTGETPDGLCYLVMDYAEGATLLALLGELAPMPGPRVIALVSQLCAGLEHAHERGLIHRDFKPENVIVERARDGVDIPKIVDFGVAILRDDAVSTRSDRLTSFGLVLGTPHYMAPEQATGAPIDHRIDLFALGVMTFEMLTGRPPYDGDGVDLALANLVQATPVMSVRVPGLRVDPLLEAFTRMLMMKPRDARPATAKAARDLIELIGRDRPAAAAALGVELEGTPAAPAPPRAKPAPASPPAHYGGHAVLPLAFQLAAAPAPHAFVDPRVAEQTWTPHSWPGASAASDHFAEIAPRYQGRKIAAGIGLVTVAAIVIAVAARWTTTPSAPELASVPAIDAVSPTIATPRPSGVAAVAAPENDPPPATPLIGPSGPEHAPPGDPPAHAPRPTTPTTIGKPVVQRPAPQPTWVTPVTPAHPRIAPPPAVPAVAPAAPADQADHATASYLAQHYVLVGQRLKRLDQTKGARAAADLWSPYLRIRINEVIGVPAKREQAEGVLRRLDDQIASRAK